MSEANRGKGPENLADILGRLFTSRGWGRKNDRLRLEYARSHPVLKTRVVSTVSPTINFSAPVPGF